MDTGPDHDEVLRRIGQALAMMDQRPLAVFERVRYRNLDYFQIAAELGLTVRQVERAFAAALLHIARCVDGDGGP
jgi:DNA-directed RNA polymerase specialized sigma24 family protein